MSLNKVMLIGNVGKDPEVRYLDGASGNAKVATFTLATTERYKDRNGETKENTEWHNIVAWRGLADICEKYVKKGTQVYIEGRIRTRSWDDQSGGKRYTTEIMADNMQLLGRKADNPGSADNYGGGQYQTGRQGGYNGQQSGYPQQGGYSGQQAGGYTPKPAGPVQPPVVEADSDDDLPF